MKIRIILLLLTLIGIISCERILEEKRHQDDKENYTSPYMGKFVGKYSGDENGDVLINVAKNGDVSGNYGLNNEIIIGAVLDNGSLLQVHSITSNFKLMGNLRNQNGNAIGTWQQNERAGTWSIVKQ